MAGKVVLVAGGATGIGRGMVDAFSRLGAAVGIVDIDEASARQAAADLSAAGGKALARRCDLGIADDVRGAVEAIWAEFGQIDVLVCNAANHGPRTGVLDYSLEDWNAVLRVNLSGTFLMSQGVARRMVQAGVRGALVNVLAIQSTIPLPGYSAYVASKGGLEAFTRALAVELAPYGIRANGIVLGSMFSGSTAPTLLGGAAARRDYEDVPPEIDASAATLVGRMGRPSDAASLATFLASDEAAFMTGALVVLDGGRLLNRGHDSLTPEVTQGL